MTNEEVKEVIEEPINAEETEEEFSPWYYFFSQGCGWCKKATPVVEQSNESGKFPEVLLLDTAETDNAKLRDELFSEYKTSCGTPFFINADTGESVCGFREKDVLEKWLSGEHIPTPPRVQGQFPKVPFDGSDITDNAKWKVEYTSWLSDNEHMPKEWQDKQKTAEEVLGNPRPKSDPPALPPMNTAKESDIDVWGEKLKVWQEENKHLPNLQPVDNIVANFKQRLQQQKNGVATGTAASAGGMNVPEVVAKVNTVSAKVAALEVKMDKLMDHFGVK